MYSREKSDSPIVPENPPNNHGDDKPCAEVVEERGGLMWNAKQGGMYRTQSRAFPGAHSCGEHVTRFVARAKSC
jgi:hypothetical protein